MIKPILYIIIFKLIFLTTYFELKTTIKIDDKVDFFTTDNFGNIYIYDNILKKYNKEGKLLSVYSENTSSTLSSIDVTDPFYILLYYQNTNSIIFLDNNLSKIGNTVNLDKLGFYSVSAVCKSKQNAIWFFDDYENKLLQYNFNTKQISQQIYLDKKIFMQIKIKEQTNFIYLQNGKNQIDIYDNTGLLIENLKFENIFQFKGENIMYCNNRYIFSYNFETKQKDSIELENINKFKELRIENNLLYVLNADSISIYKYK